MNWDPRQFDSEWPFDVMQTRFELDAATTALVVVDLQVDQMTVAPDAPLATRHPGIVAYYSRRIEETVMPNAIRMMTHFRRRGGKIIYTRNGCMTSTGEEMTARLKRKARDPEAGSRRSDPGYQIDGRLAPRDCDLIVDKLTSGAFTASFLDHALRNMGIRSLVLIGVLTDACVFGTARAAAELGYHSLLCEDACATFTQRAHDDALLMHTRIFGRVDRTEAILAELEAADVT